MHTVSPFPIVACATAFAWGRKICQHYLRLLARPWADGLLFTERQSMHPLFNRQGNAKSGRSPVPSLCHHSERWSVYGEERHLNWEQNWLLIEVPEVRNWSSPPLLQAFFFLVNERNMRILMFAWTHLVAHGTKGFQQKALTWTERKTTHDAPLLCVVFPSRLPVPPCQCFPLETFLAFSSWKEVVKGRKQHFCYVLLHHAASQHLPFYSNTGTICLTLVSLSLCFWVPRSNANPYKFSLSAHPSHPIPSQVTTLGLSCQYHYSTSSLSKAKATRLTLSSSHKFLVHHLLQRWHWQEILYGSWGEPETSLTAVSGFVLNETLDHKVSNL